MPRINHEEYEVLKELDDKWKWIARDEDRGLYALTKKPVRRYDPFPYWDTETRDPYSAFELFDEKHLFQFIQWSNSEPYDIAELIEEYEDSKEYKDSLVIEYFLDKAKESEETEVKNIEELKSWFEDDKLYSGKYVKHKINQLDVPEVLSSDWIKDNQLMWASIHGVEYYVPANKLYGKIVPKQEVKELEQ